MALNDVFFEARADCLMQDEKVHIFERVEGTGGKHGFVLAQPVSIVYGHPVLLPLEDAEVTQKTLTEYELYCGPVSCCLACVLCFVFFPAAPCVACCPCDLRRRSSSGVFVV